MQLRQSSRTQAKIKLALQGCSGSWKTLSSLLLDYGQEKGKKRVVCKDGLRRVCDMIKLDFTIDCKKYSELFALDPSLCPCFHAKGNKVIAGVLGNGFLLRHKWILDYSGV